MAHLYQHITQSGSECYEWRCDDCHRPNPYGDRGIFIPKEWVRNNLTRQQIATLPIIRADGELKCRKCGAIGAEWHHWAPKGIFGGEADEWPVDPLCKKCHDQWHRMVTPQLVNPTD